MSSVVSAESVLFFMFGPFTLQCEMAYPTAYDDESTAGPALLSSLTHRTA